MGSKKEKAPHQSSTRGGGFTGLPHVVQDSDAFRHLSFVARAVLLSVVRRFNGRNNGAIFVSFDEICHDLNTTNRRAIGRSFAQLVEHGLVEITAPPSRSHHKAREYRLTWINTTPGNRFMQATEEYRHWTPHQKKNHGDEASPMGGFHGDDVSPSARVHSDNVSLRIQNYRAKSGEPVLVHGDDVSLHVLRHTPEAQPGERSPLETLAGIPPKKSGAACEKCGEPFVGPKRSGANAKRFCSEKCRKALEHERARDRRREAA